MKLVRNIKAISGLSLILLLLISFVIGAFLSYLWVIGGVIELGIIVPGEPNIAITNVSFTPQNTGFFNITFLNPSYSPSDANITRITVSTENGLVHNLTDVSPSLPFELQRATKDFPGNQTFQCVWNWANFTGETIGISAFLEEGSGPTFEASTPFVSLQITDTRFDPATSYNYFNITVQNHEDSGSYVNLTSVTVQAETLKSKDITPSLPHSLDPNSSATFRCSWDWSDHQNTSITIAVGTLQGYVSYTAHLTPNPSVLEVIDVLFSETDISYFDVTIRNSELSPSYFNISGILLTLENDTIVEINGTEIEPFLPYSLSPDFSRTFRCPWNWTAYRNKNVTIGVHTLQNYTVTYLTVTPSPIEITNATFDPMNTSSYNVTVRNSEFYIKPVNLTAIAIVFENGTTQNINGAETTPQLPYTLESNSNVTFVCPWDWSSYQGRIITIVLNSAENYTRRFSRTTPKRASLAIISVVFDSINTLTFDIAVRNSEFSLEDVSINKIKLAFENETMIEISGVLPFLPYTLNPDSTVTFRCTWDWTVYRGKNVVIIVYTERGYTTSTQYTTPPSFH